jgi:DNA-binding response OmpR family regulator
MTADAAARVLVLIFDSPQRDLIVLALKRSGYAPVVCDELPRVRDLIAIHQPAILLLDLVLPGMNGLDLLRALAREGLLAGRFIMTVSAMGFPEVVRQAAMAGVHAFLVKPVRTDVMIERLKAAERGV